MKGLQLAIAAGIAAALGAIGATIWIGAHVREDTVVAKPYEEGLQHDAERRAREALGLAVRLLGDAPEAGAGPIAFELLDRAGSPVEGAAVRVEISRTETSRGERSAAARAAGPGRYVADLAFPEPGRWDVRFDVTRGRERVRLERRADVRAACDLSGGPCTRRLPGGGEVTLELSPRPLRTMQPLSVRALVREVADGAAVSTTFSMPGMDMGENRSVLARREAGRYEGGAVLVRCPSGQRAWVAEAAISPPGGAARTARFPFTVSE